MFIFLLIFPQNLLYWSFLAGEAGIRLLLKNVQSGGRGDWTVAFPKSASGICRGLPTSGICFFQWLAWSAGFFLTPRPAKQAHFWHLWDFCEQINSKKCIKDTISAQHSTRYFSFFFLSLGNPQGGLACGFPIAASGDPIHPGVFKQRSVGIQKMCRNNHTNYVQKCQSLPCVSRPCHPWSAGCQLDEVEPVGVGDTPSFRSIISPNMLHWMKRSYEDFHGGERSHQWRLITQNIL